MNGPNRAADSNRAAIEAQRRAEIARQRAEAAREEARQKAEAAKKQAEAAKAAQETARNARDDVHAARGKLGDDKLSPAQRKDVTADVREKETTYREARRDAVEQTAKAQRMLERAEKVEDKAVRRTEVANDRAETAGTAPVSTRDGFEVASAKNQGTYDRLFGPSAGNRSLERTLGLGAIIGRARTTDAQLDAARERISVSGGGRGADGERRDAAAQLTRELDALPDQAARQRFLDAARPELREIARGANGKPDEDVRMDILRAFVDAGQKAGPAGAQVLAESFADVAVNDHTDVDNGDQLGGALKAVINENGDGELFGTALGNELGSREGLGEVTENVRKGVYEAVADKNPSKLSRIAGEVGEAWDDLTTFVAEKYLDVFDPLTNRLDAQVDELGPGDSFEVDVGADVKAVLGVELNAGLEISRAESGSGYTVAFEANLEGEVGAKLKGKIPGLDKVMGELGGDAEANVHGGVKLEFGFDDRQAAKDGANTIVRTAVSAVSPPSLAATTLAHAKTGDFDNLVSNLKALELKAGVGANGEADLALLKQLGFEGSAEVSVDAKLRIDLDGLKPTAVSLIAEGSGKLEAAADAGGASAKGKIDAKVAIVNRATLEEGQTLDFGNPLAGLDVETSVKVEATAVGGADFGVKKANAGGYGGVKLNAELKGSPGELLESSLGLQRLMQGDLPGAKRAFDGTELTASIHGVTQETTNFEAAVGPAEVYYRSTFEDVTDRPLVQLGG